MPSTFGPLREILLNEFTESEVKALCDKMGVEYEHLAGTGVFGKTRELLLFAQQQDRLAQLAAHMRAIHPDAFAEQEHLDASDNAPPDPVAEEDAYAGNTASSQDVARETEQSYVVAPRARLLFLLALITTIVIFGALIVFLPALLNRSPSPESQAASVNRAPDAAPAATTTTTEIREAVPTIPNSQPNSTIAPSIVVVATPAPISNIPVIANEPTAPVQVTKKPGAATASHPAAQVVQDANAILPSLYRGEITTEAIQAYWSNEAYRVTVSWNEKLPAAMKLQQMPRSSLIVSYQLVSPPAVTSNSDGNYTITTTEYWGFVNPSANVALCDTREYVYSVSETNGRYLIRAVTSKLLDKRCR